jgi:hypothetical protein
VGLESRVFDLASGKVVLTFLWNDMDYVNVLDDGRLLSVLGDVVCDLERGERTSFGPSIVPDTLEPLRRLLEAEESTATRS